MAERGALLRGGRTARPDRPEVPATGRTLRGTPRIALAMLPPAPEIASAAAAIVADAADLLPDDPSLVATVAAVAAERSADEQSVATIAAAAKRAEGDAIARERGAIEAERRAIADERAAFEASMEQERLAAIEAGRAEGIAAAEAEIETLRGRLRATLSALHESHAGPDETAAIVAELAIVVARRVIGETVRTDITSLTARVRGAIAAIGLESELVLRAEPATAALLRAELVDERRLRIDEDPRMASGAVELEGGANRLDAGIDAAIEAVAAALREEVAR